jgi:hypothetical protein
MPQAGTMRPSTTRKKPTSATSGSRVPQPGAGVRSRTCEPAHDRLALGDELDDPYVSERGQERFDPPARRRGESGRVQIFKDAEVAVVHHLVDEPTDDVLRVPIRHGASHR